MAYKLKVDIANKKNYGGWRSTSKIKYINIHYTGNDGDRDENNGNYFQNNIVKASAHYFVDDDSVTQSVPDDYVAWSVGGSKYSDCSKTGGGKHHGKCTNTNSLNIELCDTVKDGKVYPSKKTIENALELTKYLMKKYGIPAANVIRHFDVTGKKCPAYWCGTSAKDKKWKSEFHNKLTAKESTKETTKKTSSTSTGATKTTESTNESFKVKITVDKLNYRTGPGTKYKVAGQVEKDEVFTITETKGSWGKLKSDAGWINTSAKYCKRV